MDRPFKDRNIEVLEELFREHTDKRPVLAQLYQELEHRSTDRAGQLQREIRGVLDGIIPRPEDQPREDDLDYQMSIEDLLDENEA